MGTDRWAELAISLVLAALFAFLAVEAGEWNYRSALFPQVIGAAGVFAVAVLVFVRVVLKRIPVQPSDHPGAISRLQDDAAEEPAGSDEHIRAFRLLLWIVSVVGLSWLLGQIVAMSLFMLAFLRYESGVRWVNAVFSAALTGGFLYVVFDRVLNVTWLDGAIYPLLASVLGWVHW